MSDNLRIVLNELHSVFETLYGERLVQMVLFGSHARGDMTLGSDIDVLVALEGQVEPGDEIARTGKIVAALSLQYDVVISCLFVSATRFRDEQSPLLLNIRREGIPV